MNKVRSNVNGVYTPTMKYTFDDGTNTSVLISNNVNHRDMSLTDLDDDSKRLKISLYGDNINMTGLYKHGFTVEADNAIDALKLGNYFITIASKLLQWSDKLVETGHYTTMHPKYNKENGKMYVIDDIYDTESIEELEILKNTFKGWMREEEVKSAYEAQENKLLGITSKKLEKIARQTKQTYPQDKTMPFKPLPVTQDSKK